MIPEYRVREGPPVGVAQQYQRMGDISLAPGGALSEASGQPLEPRGD